ncbi:YciE/YciF ferroxidase family protein [Epilithonimonas arachidiradicis]|uniref:Ferritin-like metal-binding protein YciE n=1 Tax=Epilithonimonas arachidiradicis TaxID=1617282 RepID=A0A420D8W4_9FLAO|nr:ferritin-like domain-containing protein [Epilithonimonas arachidiradicis]RKE87202.1 ferritin-like metal-binding protein YciE [Epilithonimonas arachidiradicis]GGG59110.1 YciE/YciF family protein [Epilithonimonas arachidiradicis]
MATKTENNTSSTVKKDIVENLTQTPLQSQYKDKDQSMADSPLHKLFVDALKDIYYAENAIVDALEKMEAAATTEELKDAFEDHQLQTKKHVSRLEKVFKLIGEQPEKKECKAIVGIIKEGEEIIKSTEEGSMTRDVGLIIAAQKVEHYEIATYGGLVQLAITMGHDKAADLLERTLQEEEDTDLLLTDIAESSININAEQED